MKLFSPFLTVVLLGAALAGSCTRQIVDNDIEQPITVNASFAEKVGTKATVVDGGKDLYWEAGDKIKVFYEDRSSVLDCSTTSTATSSSFTGTFRGQILFGGSAILGLYPSREEAVLNDGKISVPLPWQQTAVAGGIQKDLLICASSGTNLKMKFRPVCSGIRFSVLRSDIKTVTLEGTGGEALAGKLQIAFGDNGPSVKSVSEVQKKIVLSAPAGKYLVPGKWYHIVCAPKTFTKGYKLTFETDSLYSELEILDQVSLSRNVFDNYDAADRGLIFVKPGEKPGTEFEKASDVVKNMKVGWNCGNSLDSHGIACEYNTKYNCGGDKVLGFETGWHNPKIKPSLYPFVYNAGFRAIRLPVTWYPFMDNAGKVDEKWMNRVEEVVNYVLDAGLYCILDVHHDAGSKDTRWITADPATYDNVSARFKYLWEQIGTRFANYGPKLLFEGYNEILDANCNWDSSDADSYSVANKLNQDFVDLIRGMGGKNKYRNLVVNTYAASAHEGPVKAFKMPTDVVKDHIIVGVHNYAPYRFAFDQEDPEEDVKVFTAAGETEVKKYIKIVNDNLVAKGYPCIMGEFGAVAKDNDGERAKQAACYVSTAKEYGICSFVWNTLIIEADRDIPAWSAPLVKDAMLGAVIDSDVPSYYANHIKEKTKTVQTLKADELDAFIFLTDSHLPDNTMHAASLIEVLAGQMKYPKVFWGGDAISASTDNISQQWNTLAKDFSRLSKKASVFACHGNHDLTSTTTMPKSEVRSKFSEAMNKVVWPTTESDALYYYFDNTDSGIRYIVVDDFDKFGDSAEERAVYQNVNTKQMDWIFGDAVMKAPADSRLVFVMHCNAAFGVSNVYKALSSLARHEDYGSYQFSTRKDLKVLFTIGGHYHHDMQIVTDGVFHIQSECDARYSQGFIRNPFADAGSTRDSGTINEQAFDYVSISKDCSTLTLVRVGHGGNRLYHLTPAEIKTGASIQLASKNVKSWHCYDSESTYSSGTWTLTNKVAEISASGLVTAKSKGEAVAVAMDAARNLELYYIKVE